MSKGREKCLSTVRAQLVEGCSDEEIGLALGAGPRTVQRHLRQLYRELGVETRADALARLRFDARLAMRTL